MTIELSFAVFAAISFAAIPVVRWVFRVPAATGRTMPVIWDDLA